MNLFTLCKQALLCPVITDKIKLLNEIYKIWQKKQLSTDNLDKIEVFTSPGRPEKPILVAPRNLPKRKLTNKEGRAALIHAIAHIEFNAINLALDAVYRFRDMPCKYYDNWLQVAMDEAKHFQLLNSHLNNLGFDYGHFPAHNGLWELAVQTSDDVLARMALVPKVMEARGLDVTPGLITKFSSVGDEAACEILEIILAEEISHVAYGNYWFEYACNKRGICPQETFKQLIKENCQASIKSPLAIELRAQAGFKSEELNWLQTVCN